MASCKQPSTLVHVPFWRQLHKFIQIYVNRRGDRPQVQTQVKDEPESKDALAQVIVWPHIGGNSKRTRHGFQGCEASMPWVRNSLPAGGTVSTKWQAVIARQERGGYKPIGTQSSTIPMGGTARGSRNAIYRPKTSRYQRICEDLSCSPSSGQLESLLDYNDVTVF